MTKEEIKRIRDISYDDCRLCDSEEMCGNMTIQGCKDKINSHSHSQEIGKNIKKELEIINARNSSIKSLLREADQKTAALIDYINGIPWEEIEKSSLEDLKKLKESLKSRLYTVTFWDKLIILIDQKKKERFPEYAVVRYYPVLKEIDFLTPEQLKSVDEALSLYRKGQFINGSFNKMLIDSKELQKICDFLVSKGALIEFNQLYCPDCDERMLTYQEGEEMPYEDGLGCENCDEYFEGEDLIKIIDDSRKTYQLKIERSSDFEKL